MLKIETERLTVEPMNNTELLELAKRYEGIPELNLAYREMLDNCILYPGQQAWFTAWKICLRTGGSELGYAGFKGFNDGRPEIGYGINEEYESMGYATEAVRALCDWALSVPGVIAVEAEAETDNLASKRVLIKCGFVEAGVSGAEGPRYIRSV